VHCKWHDDDDDDDDDAVKESDTVLIWTLATDTFYIYEHRLQLYLVKLGYSLAITVSDFVSLVRLLKVYASNIPKVTDKFARCWLM